jgi:hypothetical protein
MIRTFPHRRSATALRRVTEGESERTILIALFANIVIAVAKLTGGQAMDDIDRKIRQALPVVADVFIDITASRAREHSRTQSVNRT